MNITIGRSNTTNRKLLRSLAVTLTVAVVTLGAIASVSRSFESDAPVPVSAQSVKAVAELQEPAATAYFLVDNREQAAALWSLTEGETATLNIVVVETLADELAFVRTAEEAFQSGRNLHVADLRGR